MWKKKKTNNKGVRWKPCGILMNYIEDWRYDDNYFSMKARFYDYFSLGKRSDT